MTLRIPHVIYWGGGVRFIYYALIVTSHRSLRLASRLNVDENAIAAAQS